MSSYFSSINVADSILKLYVPTLIETTGNEFAKLIVSSVKTSLNVVTSQSIVLNSCIKAGFDSVSSFFSPSEFIDLILGVQLDKARYTLTNLSTSLHFNYTCYVSFQKHYTQQIKSNIHFINEAKKILKEVVLVGVAKKLTEMGVDNTIGNCHIEHLDDNILRMDSGLKYVVSEMDDFTSEMEKMDSSFLDFIGNPIGYVINNHRKTKLIEEKVYAFETIIRDESERMKADLERLALFDTAIENVHNIYQDIVFVLSPMIVYIIIDIKEKYHDNVDEIPSDILRALHTSCKILKGMAEKNILGNQRSKEATTDDVIKYSNELSLKYNEIKETLLKVA